MKGVQSLSDELKELQKITKILTFAHAKAVEDEISKYATTDERKKVWVLIDGKNMTKDMVRLIGKVKTRAVDTFLKELEKAGLIENPRKKPPRKLIDYVPPVWIALLEETKDKKKEGKKIE